MLDDSGLPELLPSVLILMDKLAVFLGLLELDKNPT